MIYVFREAASDGARQLAEAINARRIRNEERMRLRAGDLVVAWGETFDPQTAGVRVLNGAAPIRGKFTDATQLAEAGVRTVKVARNRPQAIAQAAPADPAVAGLRAVFELADDFVDHSEDLLNGTPVRIPRTPVYVDGIAQLYASLGTYLQQVRVAAPVAPPAQPVGEWVGRTNNHTGGMDLLTPTRNPDYFVEKEAFTAEYRVHSFLGRSIRAGKKVFRDGYSANGANGTRQASPWIRSWDGGWKISYDGASVKQRHRDIAHAAVRALGLDFGAVDIGEKADGTLVVLEVNRAPGLEGGTVNAYAGAFAKWQSGEWTMKVPEGDARPVADRRRAA